MIYFATVKQKFLEIYYELENKWTKHKVQLTNSYILYAMYQYRFHVIKTEDECSKTTELLACNTSIFIMLAVMNPYSIVFTVQEVLFRSKTIDII
jgi:hypothetical protein